MEVLRNRTFLALTGISLVLLAASVLLVFFNAGQFPSRLVIHFDAFRGIDFIGDISDVWWFIGITAGVVALNGALGAAFYYRERMVTFCLAGANILLSLLLLISISTIITVN